MLEEWKLKKKEGKLGDSQNQPKTPKILRFEDLLRKDITFSQIQQAAGPLEVVDGEKSSIKKSKAKGSKANTPHKEKNSRSQTPKKEGFNPSRALDFKVSENEESEGEIPRELQNIFEAEESVKDSQKEEEIAEKTKETIEKLKEFFNKAENIEMSGEFLEEVSEFFRNIKSEVRVRKDGGVECESLYGEQLMRSPYFWFFLWKLNMDFFFGFGPLTFFENARKHSGNTKVASSWLFLLTRRKFKGKRSSDWWKQKRKNGR